MSASIHAVSFLPLWIILEPICLSTAPFLTCANHSRTRRSSTILLLFWPLYILVLLIWTRTIHGLGEWLPVSIALRTTTALFGLIAFALECVGPEVGSTADRENPVTTANIFSIWTFQWMTPLLRKGASQFITEDDLPPLLSKDESAKLGSDLEDALKRQ